VKLPQFAYEQPNSLEEAIEMLAADEDAKIIAGGQSLLPLLALRLARPTTLVDITRLGLDGISVVPVAGKDLDGSPSSSPFSDRTELVVGSLVRQRRLEFEESVSDACPLLTDAVRQVGYPATRNLGTLGGSLAHCDPTAELLAVAVALDAYVVAAGPDGRRAIPCTDLSDGFFMNSLLPGEIITEVHLPTASSIHGAAWCEWSPRAHDFAEAGVGVAVDLDTNGTCVRVGAAACAIGGAPLNLSHVLISSGVVGATVPTRELLADVSAAIEVATVSAGPDRASLTGLLAAKAVLRAFDRALSGGLEQIT
jgi:carbon-monoxide dehydrogenase medium subunit